MTEDHSSLLSVSARESGGCASCASRSICLGAGLPTGEISRLNAIRLPNRRISKDEPLIRPGDDMVALFAVRSGQLKSSLINDAGTSKVLAFHLSGDVIGFDGLANGKHQIATTALDGGEVCVLPIHPLERLAEVMPALQRQLLSGLSKTINESHHHLLISDRRSEQRFADFLVSLSSKWALRGYSAKEFILRMSRDDLASHLGVTVETICRLIAKFRTAGLIDSLQRHIVLLNLSSLRAIAAGENS